MDGKDQVPEPIDPFTAGFAARNQAILDAYRQKQESMMEVFQERNEIAKQQFYASFGIGECEQFLASQKPVGDQP